MAGATTDSYHETKVTDQYGALRTLKVPIVQELARQGVQDIPQIFIWEPSDSITTTISCSSDDFPSVSLAKLQAMKGDEREKELEKLVAVTREWSMVLISDHGVPMPLLGAVKDVVKGFFGLSIEEKRKAVGTYNIVDNMGYGRTQFHAECQKHVWVDRLIMMAAPKGATNGLNVRPQNPANFRETIESYAEEARKLGGKLLKSFAEALSLEKNAFFRQFDLEYSEIKLRINYYPPCPKPSSTFGLRPHSDPSSISILIQMDNSDGLQVMHKVEKCWLCVPWPIDALLVNIGDLLEIISDGVLQSSVHRVVSQSDIERYSVALFYVPSSSTEIEPVKKDNSESKYKNVIVSEYLQNYSKLGTTPNKDALKFAMV